MLWLPHTDEGQRLELLARVNDILRDPIPADGIHRRPGFPLSTLGDEAALRQFLAAFSRVVAEIRLHA